MVEDPEGRDGCDLEPRSKVMDRGRERGNDIGTYTVVRLGCADAVRLHIVFRDIEIESLQLSRFFQETTLKVELSAQVNLVLPASA